MNEKIVLLWATVFGLLVGLIASPSSAQNFPTSAPGGWGRTKLSRR